MSPAVEVKSKQTRPPPLWRSSPGTFKKLWKTIFKHQCLWSCRAPVQFYSKVTSKFGNYSLTRTEWMTPTYWLLLIPSTSEILGCFGSFLTPLVCTAYSSKHCDMVCIVIYMEISTANCPWKTTTCGLAMYVCLLNFRSGNETKTWRTVDAFVTFNQCDEIVTWGNAEKAFITINKFTTQT